MQNVGFPFSLLQFFISSSASSPSKTTPFAAFALPFVPTIWIILCMRSQGACNQNCHHIHSSTPCNGQFGKIRVRAWAWRIFGKLCWRPIQVFENLPLLQKLCLNWGENMERKSNQSYKKFVF